MVMSGAMLFMLVRTCTALHAVHVQVMGERLIELIVSVLLMLTLGALFAVAGFMSLSAVMMA
ncbi:hypothetical protein CXR34_08060 [Microbacterium hominis]|uniref:Uncharacterized protein n=3 Tax=Microbacterium TaxID=33882 RepID=A0A2K9DM18_9MICO|nr:hypothetical protein CXR34_08060 [Microbacterium hominis]